MRTRRSGWCGTQSRGRGGATGAGGRGRSTRRELAPRSSAGKRGPPCLVDEDARPAFSLCVCPVPGTELGLSFTE